ncbi:MAG: oligosaccharide flippase family protein [Planctomycetes bacterium]|nr:oligosaccharide flippase family protein [Planctomycetota bacterium]MCB9909605.1 oligosaccharide flippase family protein [Planctomycetota bacterium]MCB9911906.1 oligosaccharide flippase family protein [Planctomycetota bacterium]HPF14045.1 oligosaccharide flippase family protein [Planctomycetota bacterium]HRV79999.1 oligosaccharide flippase family protein [Planctomycetota bacterium]
MLKNVGSNWALSFAQILIFFVLVPFVFSTLGPSRNGVWELIVATSGPLQLLALGMPMATVRHVTAAVAAGRPQEAERVIGNSLSLSMCLALVAMVFGSGIYWATNHAIISSEDWNLSPADLRDAQHALIGVLILVGSSFALRLPYAVYDAHHDFVVRNLIQGSGFVLRFGLTLLLLSWKASLTIMAGILITVALTEFLVSITVSARRHSPIRIRPRRMEWSVIRGLISFGAFAFLMNMGALLAFQIDAMVIGDHLLPRDVTDYAMGNKIFEQFITLVLAIGMVAMPMATDLHAREDWGGLRIVFLKWSKIASTLVLLIGGYLMVLGPEFLRVWFGDGYTPHMGQVLQILMASFFLFLPMRGVALPILMGLGKTRGPGIGLFAMGVTNLVLSLVLVRSHGVLGVALGTAIPNVAFGCFFLYLACKHLRVPLGEFLHYVGLRSLIGLLPGVAFLLFCKLGLQVEHTLPVLGAGVAYTALFGLIQVFFVFRNDPMTDPLALVQRKLSRPT